MIAPGGPWARTLRYPGGPLGTRGPGPLGPEGPLDPGVLPGGVQGGE